MGIQSRRAKIYFDGLCRVCSSEMKHYSRLRGAENFDFIDITHPLFNAEAEGLDPFQVHKEMHVRTPDGELRVGVAAFLEIWSHLPSYRWAVPLASAPLVRPTLDRAYSIFAEYIRPKLPKAKREDCQDSPYCEWKKPS